MVCDSEEVADASALRWAREGWSRLKMEGEMPEQVDALRALAEEGWFGRVERHRVATSEDLLNAS